MVKKLHYIKEDYSGSIEKYCLKTYKNLYPDFEFMAWKPGSSPLRILYDHGGLFIGPNFFALNRIDDFYFDRSFLVFNNSLNTDKVNINNCCYAASPNEEIFMDFMKKGVDTVLAERGYAGNFRAKMAPNGFTMTLREIDIFDRISFGGFDKLSLEVYTKGVYLMDTNMRFDPALDYHLHYMIVNKDTESNKVHALCESFYNMKCEDSSRHYLLLVCNDLERNLCSIMGELINYKNVNENKVGNIVVVGNGVEEKEVEKLLVEYVGRKFVNLKSCERLL